MRALLNASQLHCAYLNDTARPQNVSLSAVQANPSTRVRFVFTPQSSGLTFSEWISLLTLALAPLLAHIFVGGPQIVVLTPRKPRWLDIACIYNPTTILWRYYSIAVRRATAKNWKPYDAAVANSAFWTGTSWDGSLSVAKIARRSCTRVGTESYIRLLSKSAAQTVIVALQGAQTETSLIISGKHLDSGEEIGLPNIFGFITLIGLFRLLVAPWLVEDFSFVDFDEQNAVDVRTKMRDDVGLETSEYRLNSWRIWAIRIVLFATLAAQVVPAMLLSKPVGERGLVYTATRVALLVFAIYFIFATLCVFYWQMARGNDMQVVPSAVNTGFYKVYTVSVYAGLLTMFVIACLETRRTFCGVYTTIPKGMDMDVGTCRRMGYI
jgi:hypothetical protein